jgi:hypothetical protein
VNTAEHSFGPSWENVFTRVHPWFLALAVLCALRALP